MKRKYVCVLFCFFLSVEGFSQKTDTLVKKLDSLRNEPDSAHATIDTRRESYNAQTKLNFKTYFVLLGSNLKQQITGPFHTSKKSWLQVGGLAVATGLLGFADVPVQKEAVSIRNKFPTVRKVSHFITNFGGMYEGYTLAALGTYGFLFKNEKMQTTTLLATQAYITGATVMQVVKLLTGRQRPSYYGNDSVPAKATFHGPFDKAGREYNGQKISSSFPSGHTTVAFAAATVFATEYKDRTWVKIFAYTAASMIGISRITENKHWTTDVVVGGALGYLRGRQVSRNYHRFADIRSGKEKGKLSLNLQYNSGRVMPGLVYTFR